MLPRSLPALLPLALLIACSESSGPKCSITGVSIGASTREMTVGETVALVATWTQRGCATLPPLDWLSSAPAIVSVSADGTLRAVAAGNATITARARGRTEAASVAVSVRGRVVSLTIDPPTLTIPVAATAPLTPRISVDPGTPVGVRWRSSDPSRATVDAAGLVSGIAAGTATITATSDADTTVRASATVTVVPRVSALTVAPERLQLPVAATHQLQAMITGDSGVVSTVTWSSEAPTIATVAPTGLVTAVGAGATRIVARSVADTSRRATVLVTVIPRVLGLTMTPSGASLRVASMLQLAATVTGDPGVDTSVTWTSSSPANLTVTATGLVTGVSAGTATVTVRAKGDTTQSVSAPFTVTPRVIAVIVTPATGSVATGASIALAAVVQGDSGVAPQVTWRTSDPARATVSAGGVVTGVAAGPVTVFATALADTTKSGTATIIVQPRVTGLVVAPTSASIAAGTTVQLSATVTGDPGVNTAVTWTSSDATRASVSATGLVTGVSPGTVTITAASVVLPELRASATITVTPVIAPLQCLMMVPPPGAAFGPEGSPAPPTATCLTPSTVLTTLTIVGVRDANNLIVAMTSLSSSNPQAVAAGLGTIPTTGVAFPTGGGVATITAVTARGTISVTLTSQPAPAQGGQRVAPGRPGGPLTPPRPVSRVPQ